MHARMRTPPHALTPTHPSGWNIIFEIPSGLDFNISAFLCLKDPFVSCIKYLLRFDHGFRLISVCRSFVFDICCIMQYH